ncbi:MAG: lytic transglycosylase domain-containing protein [Fidelibacterota bacterium]
MKLLVCLAFNLAWLAGQEWTRDVETRLVDVIAHNDLARQVYGEVIARLRQEGIPPDFLEKTFSDPAIKIDDEVVSRFNHPFEKLSYDRYRELFVTAERVATGTEFYETHHLLLETVSDSFGVDPFLLTSIVGIESKYGEKSEQFSVFNALHTIIHKLPEREKWAEKEMTEYLKFCYTNFIPPHSLYGSYAGAFGYGQFIPSSFNHYSIDMDGDGIRHPYQWPDVLGSIASYLVRHGYQRGDTTFSQGSSNWKAVLAYNPSVNYVRAVLDLRTALRKAVTD